MRWLFWILHFCLSSGILAKNQPQVAIDVSIWYWRTWFISWSFWLQSPISSLHLQVQVHFDLLLQRLCVPHIQCRVRWIHSHNSVLCSLWVQPHSWSLHSWLMLQEEHCTCSFQSLFLVFDIPSPGWLLQNLVPPRILFNKPLATKAMIAHFWFCSVLCLWNCIHCMATLREHLWNACMNEWRCFPCLCWDLGAHHPLILTFQLWP